MYVDCARLPSPEQPALSCCCPPNSRGSLLLARLVAARGLPVLVLPVGCRAASLPALDGAGAWTPAMAPEGLASLCGALAWQPAQSSLLLMPVVGGEQ